MPGQCLDRMPTTRWSTAISELRSIWSSVEASSPWRRRYAWAVSGRVPRLAGAATSEQRQFAFVLAALNGKADGVAWLLKDGLAINQHSADLCPHAICSGSHGTV